MKTDERSTEEKLLNVAFSSDADGVREGQRATAVQSLMRLTKLDREGLAKKCASGKIEVVWTGNFPSTMQKFEDERRLRIEAEDKLKAVEKELKNEKHDKFEIMCSHEAVADMWSSR